MNDYTKAFVYPLPRIQETLALLKDAKYFTTLDLNKGFHQCWVHEDSIQYTAFTTYRGLYEYVRMPFGLKNAPVHFQHAMNTVLGKYIQEGWAIVYIDDILIFNKTFEEHIESLRKILSALEVAGFTVSIPKCHFGCSDLIALGRHVSGLYLAIDDNKLAAVRDWPAPRNLKTLQAYLGFINYHRAHIKDLAKILRPMSSLLSKDVIWEWTAACQTSFEDSKKALLDPAILAMPDWNQPFRLYIDACFEGLGAELAQIQEGKERPIAFISRRLRPAEERYAATQLECLGLIWALEKLYYYLDGSTFAVYTDCVAIQTLMTVKNPNRHMLRWQLAIQEHRGQMTIHHKPGVTNKNADGLSRCALPNDVSNPAAELTDNVAVIYAINIAELNDDLDATIKAGIDLDARLARIREALRSETEDTKQAAEVGLPRSTLEYFRSGQFFLFDDALHLRKGVSALPCIGDTPTKQMIIAACHDQLTSGHFGFDRTLERVRQHAWWPDMNSDVETWCKTCTTCALSKRTTGKQAGLLQHIENPKRPWDIIHMDFVTALPTSATSGFNSVLAICDRATKSARFLPLRDTATAKDVATVFWKHCYSDVGFPRIIISDRDPKFTSDFWKYLQRRLGVKLNMSTAHHPQTDGLAERIIQTLVDMIRRYCAFGLEHRDKEGFRHDWVDLLPALQYAYNSTPHAVTNKAPYILERGWIPKSPFGIIAGTISTSVEVDPSAENIASMIEHARDRAHDAVVEGAFEAHKARWDSSHVAAKFAAGDEVLLSTRHFGTVGSSKLKDPFVGPFVIEKMIGDNAARLLLTPPFNRKHSTFPVSLLKLLRKPEPNSVADREQPQRVGPTRMNDDGDMYWKLDKITNEALIMDEKTQKPIRKYECHWEGYPDPSWEPVSVINKDSPAAVREWRLTKRTEEVPSTSAAVRTTSALPK